MIMVVTPAMAYSAVAPDVERNLAIEKASEWLLIDVSAVWVEQQEDKKTQIVASAVVNGVEKTASNLEVGNTILIVYTLDLAVHEQAMEKMSQDAAKGIVGLSPPGLPIIIEAGETYRAHLNLQSGDGLGGSVYSPTAAQYSFEPPAMQDQ